MRKIQKIYIAAGIVTILLFFAFIVAPLPENNITRSLLSKLENQNNWYRQQKVYLHFDKEKYTADEKVWFKAYLTDAISHKPDSSSTNLYVELINPVGYIVQTKLLKLEGGFGYGDFSFLDTVPDGFYKIRAYTNYMQNFSEEFYFSKNIYISNPQFRTYATRFEVKTVKRSHKDNIRKQAHFDISFLPEGGHLLSNINNKVAFKAINELGEGINVRGTVQDKKGKTITNFVSSHKGMGAFEFIPEKGNKYIAVVSTDERKGIKFPLPDLIDTGINLRVERQEKNLRVSMQTNITRENLPANTVYYLIAHIRGKPVYTAAMDLKDTASYYTLIPSRDLPSGILHLTLFNSRPAVVSERLTFINNNDQLKVKIISDKTITERRDPVNLSISVYDKNGKPVNSELSLSVSEVSGKNTTGNILTYLLLKSDLKGNIEDPDYYFLDESEERKQNLDYLMLTQGWRRFDWNSVIINQRYPLSFYKEQNLEITGSITRDFFNIPLKDVPVTLTILDQFNDVYTTRTDMKGRYSFKNLIYYDTVSVRIEARKQSGGKGLVINVDGKEQEQLKNMTYTTYQYLNKPGSLGRQIVEKQPEEDDNDPFKEENTRIDRIHSEPKDVVIVDESMLSYQNVGQLLQGRIAGVHVSGNKVTIRGVSTFYGSTDPLFLVDNIPVSPDYALLMNVTEVNRIEVLKGPDAAVYGIRGANGVIAIYTKRGKFMIRGQIDFRMLGFSTPSEFYSPKYSAGNYDPFEDDRQTLLWIPSLKTDSGKIQEINFFTSDIPGKYIITIEGISSDGAAGTGISYLEIK